MVVGKRQRLGSATRRNKDGTPFRHKGDRYHGRRRIEYRQARCLRGRVGEHWHNARGRALLDKNGDEVGTVEELYVWKEPTTVHLIKVSGEEGSFLIPVHAVTSVDDDGVKLETARSKVTDSPEYGSEEVPDDEARRAAFDYFGYPDPLDL